ncbi:unnamed protein product [Rhizoctonia solani]|uniref:ubiquitinyl hydrolase 1 n=1 Tax=Rhizoctonia solani TaxID=456999 RepID=A0A8H3I0P9_9AGAM|nr:unnamed protein product [Rhizoctonia solani]
MPLDMAAITGPSGILSLDGLVNPFVSSDPPEPTTFAETLLLDSTSFLRGLLRAGGQGHSSAIKYAIATAGPVTVISHPATSRNAAVIRWASGENGKRTTIETEGLVLTLDSWVKVTDWGSTKRYQRHGTQPWIKWSEKRGRWQAVDLDRRVLAVMVSRKSALGTRLKLTSTGLLYADAVVLTALITVSGPYDWKRYPPAPAEEPTGLPSYGQAPFTRPLASLTGLLPPTRVYSAPNLAIPRPAPLPVPGQPVLLTLSTHQLLSGVFSNGDRPEVVITTVGPHTTIARYVQAEDEAERKLQRISNVEWVSSSWKGKRLTRIRMHGQRKILDEIMYSSSPFFEKRERRFGSPGFLPWITWTEASSRTSSSLSLATTSSSSSIRYTCRTHPDGRPLATLSRRITSAGTSLELTPEGWDLLDAIILTGMLVLCGSHDWKRVSGIGVPVRGQEQAIDAMAVGEEMITGLDGWASPPDLVELSPGAGSGFLSPAIGDGSGYLSPAVGDGSGMLTPARAMGSLTPMMASVHATPAPSRPSSPPPINGFEFKYQGVLGIWEGFAPITVAQTPNPQSSAADSPTYSPLLGGPVPPGHLSPALGYNTNLGLSRPPSQRGGKRGERHRSPQRDNYDTAIGILNMRRDSMADNEGESGATFTHPTCFEFVVAGELCFTPPDLAHIAHELDELEQGVQDSHGGRSTNMDDTGTAIQAPIERGALICPIGYFSVQVLENALKNAFGLTLVRWRSEEMRQYHTQMGFVLNLEQHWFTIRRFGHPRRKGHWFNLNSFLESPEWVGNTYLGMVLQQAEKEGYSVFVVRPVDPSNPENMLPETEADLIAETLDPGDFGGQVQRISTTRTQSGPSNAITGAGSSSAPTGLENEDMELQRALQASIAAGYGGGSVYEFSDEPAASTSAPSVRAAPLGLGYGGDSGPPSRRTPVPADDPPTPRFEDDPVAASAARARLRLEQMQREQAAAMQGLGGLGGGYETVELDPAAASRRREAQDRVRRAREEEEEQVRQAMEASLRAHEQDEDDDNSSRYATPPVPGGFGVGNRNYDDEDAELQAALRASLESHAASSATPAAVPRPAPGAPVPAPAAVRAPSATAPSAPPVPKPTEDDEEDEEDEEEEEQAPAPPSPEVQVKAEVADPDELRRRRLARFGG